MRFDSVEKTETSKICRCLLWSEWQARGATVKLLSLSYSITYILTQLYVSILYDNYRHTHIQPWLQGIEQRVWSDQLWLHLNILKRSPFIKSAAVRTKNILMRCGMVWTVPVKALLLVCDLLSTKKPSLSWEICFPHSRTRTISTIAQLC